MAHPSHPDNVPYLLHICTSGLHEGHPPQPVSLLGSAATLSPSSWLAHAIFKPNLFLHKYPNIPNPSYSSYLPAYENGTDSVPKHWNIKFSRQGITPEESIQRPSSCLSQMLCLLIFTLQECFEQKHLLWLHLHHGPAFLNFQCLQLIPLFTFFFGMILSIAVTEPTIQVVWFVLQCYNVFSYTPCSCYQLNTQVLF